MKALANFGHAQMAAHGWPYTLSRSCWSMQQGSERHQAPAVRYLEDTRTSPRRLPEPRTANRPSGSMPGTELKVRKLVGNGTIRRKASNGSANTKDSVLKRYRWNLLKRELTSASSNLHRTPIECSAAHTLLNRNTCAEKNDKPRKLRKAVCLRSKY